MVVVPRIADVQCTRLQFQPGDRILVRSHHRIDDEHKKRLTRSIKRWAGCDVEVLVICLTEFDLEIEQR